MQKATNLNKNKYILVIFILIQAVYITIFFGIRKEGYHSDEIWNYAFANSSEYKHIYTLDDKNLNNCLEWLDSDILRDYISVDKSEIFSYAPIYKNAASDLNPPLHYMLLHFICSFFPGQWSKWFCFIINIVFFIIGQFFLYKLTNDITKNTIASYAVLILYGFGIGIINITSFLRIYAMGVTFTIMLLYYSNKVFELRKESSKQNKYIIYAFFSCLLGALTVHLFLTIAFIIVLMYSIYYFFSKNFKTMFKYGIAMSFSVLSSMALFPTSMSHLSTSSTHFEAKKYPTLWQFKIYLSYLTKDISGFHISAIPTMTLSIVLMVLFILLLLFIPFCFIFRNEKWFINAKTRTKDKIKYIVANINKCPYIILLLLCSILFFIYMSAKHSSIFRMGFYSRRYIFFIYPLFALLIVLFAFYIFKLFFKSQKIRNILLIFTSLLLTCMTYVFSYDIFSMRHKTYGTNLDSIEKDANCILLFNEIWLMTCVTNELYDTNSFYATRYKDYKQDNYNENIDTGKPLYLILDVEKVYNRETAEEIYGNVDFDNTSPSDCLLVNFDQKSEILNYYRNLSISSKLTFVGTDVLFNRMIEIYRLN